MGSFNPPGRQNSLLSSEDIIDITGPLDNEVLSAIIRTGASLEDICQASEWLDESHYTLATTEPLMDEKTRRVYEILDYAHGGIWPSVSDSDGRRP